MRTALATLAAVLVAAIIIAPAGGANPSPVQVQEISPAQAVQESLLPGAVTEGVSPLALLTGSSLIATAPQVCYHTGAPGLTVNWGSYPYQQAVHEQRDWCGELNGAQSWRSSNVTLGSYFCNNSNPRQFKTGGGNGYFYTEVESIGHFDCPTPQPWVTIHPDDYMVWRCNMAGYCPYQRSGRL